MAQQNTPRILEHGDLVVITNPAFSEFGWKGVLDIDEYNCWSIVLPDETVLGVGEEDVEAVYS